MATLSLRPGSAMTGFQSRSPEVQLVSPSHRRARTTAPRNDLEFVETNDSPSRSSGSQTLAGQRSAADSRSAVGTSFNAVQSTTLGREPATERRDGRSRRSGAGLANLVEQTAHPHGFHRAVEEESLHVLAPELA
jgi:hypothetical protein